MAETRQWDIFSGKNQTDWDFYKDYCVFPISGKFATEKFDRQTGNELPVKVPR